MSAVERGDRGGAGLIPRRRAAARGARLTDLVLCVLVDLAGAFGDAGAVTSTTSKRTRSGCCATRAEARRRGMSRLRDDPIALTSSKTLATSTTTKRTRSSCYAERGRQPR